MCFNVLFRGGETDKQGLQLDTSVYLNLASLLLCNAASIERDALDQGKDGRANGQL